MSPRLNPRSPPAPQALAALAALAAGSPQSVSMACSLLVAQSPGPGPGPREAPVVVRPGGWQLAAGNPVHARHPWPLSAIGLSPAPSAFGLWVLSWGLFLVLVK
jgi:hypothetical protein